MLLSHETVIKPDSSSANIIGHMCYGLFSSQLCRYLFRKLRFIGLLVVPVNISECAAAGSTAGNVTGGRREL